MANGSNNARFLSKIDSKSKSMILENIAKHYGISTQEAFSEVTDSEAEHLLDYMTEPARSAASVLMQKHGLRGFSRPGAKARFKVEDRFYFGKGRKERFAEIDVVNQLMQLAMKEGMADRMRPEIDRVLGSGSFDKLFKSYKSALISKRIMELKRQGKSTPEAFDLVLGAGAYKNMVGELYDALRAKASSKHSRPGAKERFADDAKQIADTILKQLGGGRFIAMTGAKNLAFMSNPPGLHMSLGRGTKDGIKYLRVNYDRGSDTYTMIFANKSGGTVKSVSHVYANSLQRVFTSTTGFDTHL